MIESYYETTVVLAPSGELALALPVYADQKGTLFDGADLSNVLGQTTKLRMGIYEPLGYIIYHPQNDFTIYMKSLQLFEDLGKL